jgi:hypothetical protein
LVKSKNPISWLTKTKKPINWKKFVSRVYRNRSTSIPLVNPHVTIDDAVTEALQTIRSRGHAIYRSGIATTSVLYCCDL